MRSYRWWWPPLLLPLLLLLLLPLLVLVLLLLRLQYATENGLRGFALLRWH